MKSEIVCLTETQLCNDLINNDLQNCFENHQLILHNNPDKFKSLAILKKSAVNVSFEKLDSVLYFESNFRAFNFRAILLYRSNQSNSRQFADYLISLVQSKMPDVIFGDFNIDFLTDSSNFLITSICMLGYEMIVTEPTHVRGSLLDHVYVRTALYNQFCCIPIIIPMYFSDHDAVIVDIISKF